MDDFEEIVKAGLLRVPCTLVCRENRKPRGEGTYKRVSMSFRPSLLPPEAVEILQAPGLRAAFSPSQRVFRVTADPTGQFKLTRAPRTDDVFFIRFPYNDKMPWVEKRVSVDVDCNPEQGAIFLEVPGVTPVRAPALALAPPVLPVAKLAETPDKISIRPDVCFPPLLPEERTVLNLLSDGTRYFKEDLVLHLQSEGHGRVSVNSVIGKIKTRLMDKGVEPTESTDRTQVWLSPMAMTALRRLMSEAA